MKHRETCTRPPARCSECRDDYYVEMVAMRVTEHPSGDGRTTWTDARKDDSEGENE